MVPDEDGAYGAWHQSTLDEELASELSTPKGEYLSSGRLKIEGKRDMKRRGLNPQTRRTP